MLKHKGIFLTTESFEVENLPDAEEAIGWLEKITPTIINYGKLILFSLVVFFIGRKLIRLLVKWMKKSFEKMGMEEGLARFLQALSKTLLNMILLVLIAGILGLETSSLVAVIGSAGLAIGLALQGSLSNFAGGVLILLAKPFVLGDHIVTPMGEGDVCDIGMIYTKLKTYENKIITIPNGTLSNSTVTNATAESQRLLDLEVSVSYQADLKKVREILGAVIEEQTLLIEKKEVTVFVKELAAHSVIMGIRVWTKGSDYWTLRWKLLEEIKDALTKEGIEIPYNQLDVHVSGVK